MNKIGFPVTFSREKNESFYEDLLVDMLEQGCEAIEIRVNQQDDSRMTNLIMKLLKRFSYRSIHCGTIISPEKSQVELQYTLALAKRMTVQAITIHPHMLEGLFWIEDYFGGLASFENMDWRKSFAQTPEDLKNIFQEVPTARWTFDLNHIYSIDPTMELANQFYALRPEGPNHYHLSGFGGVDLPHTTLVSTMQNSIIKNVRTEAPIILESYGEDDIQDFLQELNYVRSVF